MRALIILFSCLTTIPLLAQTNHYTISFGNAVHHEAQITANFSNLNNDTLFVRMSRSSPGRYALHEFAKNVYNVKATDGNGKPLTITRPDPYQWAIAGHDGSVQLRYTLFANRGGGTYSQVDETHAHLNIPATFMYAPSLKDRKIEVDFNVREDLDWKVATQLQHVSGNTYSAPNLYYFMDSPTEISDYQLRQFNVNGQTVRLALHHNGTEAEADEYFEKVKKVVLAEQAVYGELAPYDYGTYTFLACYIPNASGDGMEHRNSTIVTSTQSLANGGMSDNIGTVSHEYFHSWNVERIRPKSLEPFSFEHANMSGELWFAEGFTSYYTNLILCRAGLISQKEYVEGLTGTFNYVWNSPARQFFNVIEMSYQAPFVDAATSVDPVNRENTFISYYSYGSVLGLALDLSLREKGLTLDDFMKLVWKTYGKTEKSYSVADLRETLNTFAGKAFGNHFFDQYVYKSGMPDYHHLFETVGVTLNQNLTKPYFGGQVTDGVIVNNTKIGSSAYAAGLDNGDRLLKIGTLEVTSDFNAMLNTFKAGDTAEVIFDRFGEQKETKITFVGNPSYTIGLNEDASEEQVKARNAWLSSRDQKL